MNWQAAAWVPLKPVVRQYLRTAKTLDVCRHNGLLSIADEAWCARILSEHCTCRLAVGINDTHSVLAAGAAHEYLLLVMEIVRQWAASDQRR
jgi:hypothetical protein